MNRLMKIYLVGPITGRKYKEVVESLYVKVQVLKDAGWMILNPMIGKADLRTAVEIMPYGNYSPILQDRAIFLRDFWMVNQADVILADFRDSPRVSIGSMFELAWGYQLGKQIVTVLPDPNPHKHVFVLQASTIIFEALTPALQYLIDLIKDINP